MSSAAPLYLPEPEIARRVVGPKRVKEWDGIAAVLEREGLPKQDPLMGGRFWPAVERFFESRHGLNRLAPPSIPDGKEKW